MTKDRPAKPRDEAELEAFFDAARRTAPAPSSDLLARVMADAAGAQKLARQPVQPPWWRAAWAALGGWPSLAGLGTAALAGVLIGYSPPAALDPLLTGLSVQDTGVIVGGGLLDVLDTDLLTDL